MKLIFLVLMVSLLGAQKNETIQRTLEKFDEIEIELNAKTRIKKGSTYRITVEGAEKTLDGMIIKVRGNELYISHERNARRGWSFGNDVRVRNKRVYVEITVPEFEKLTVRGEGELRMDHFEVKEFKFNLMGTTNVESKITASEQIEVKNIGPGDLLLEMKSPEIDINNIGPGDIELSGETKRMDINVIGPGDVLAFKLKAEGLT